MAHLNIKTKNGKKYYYLRKTERKNNKIIPKDICYLGTDISKINIEELKIKFKLKNTKKLEKSLEIQNLNRQFKNQKTKENKFFDSEQLEEINKILYHFNKKFKNNNSKTKKYLQENLTIKFIIENAAMESLEEKTMKFKEAEILLNKNIYPKNKILSNVYEIANTKEILEFLKEKNPKIDIALIETLHDTLLKNIYRTKGLRNSEIKIKKNAFKPSKAKDVKSDLKKLIKWYNKNKERIHPLALTALFHNKFEKIHPFTEGNGEVGRILVNYILDKFEYPWIIIEKKRKKEYHRSMGIAYKSLKEDLLDTDMRYHKELINFMYEQFVKTYWENYL